MQTGQHAEYLGTREAARFLDVKPATLYTYVSRGWLTRVQRPGSRTSAYLRSELADLKARREARSGHAAVAAGALRWGQPVIDSAVSTIEAGMLIYRGHDAVDLARRGVPFEHVAELLWTGDLPETGLRWQPATTRGPKGSDTGTDPLGRLLTSVVAQRASTSHRDTPDAAEELARARRLIAGLTRQLVPGRNARRASSVAGTLASGWSRTAAAAAIDAALVLTADHELNASTFAARVAASTGADLYACIAAALGALSGPRHGTHSAHVLAFMREASSYRRPGDLVRKRLSRGESPPGFGHPLYAEGDPRAKALLAIAHRTRSPFRSTFAAVEHAAARAELPPPNLDFGLAALVLTHDLPDAAAPALFAIGRMAGWTAHILEQRESRALLRPRARYVGRRPCGA